MLHIIFDSLILCFDNKTKNKKPETDLRIKSQITKTNSLALYFLKLLIYKADLKIRNLKWKIISSSTWPRESDRKTTVVGKKEKERAQVKWEGTVEDLGFKRSYVVGDGNWEIRCVVVLCGVGDSYRW